MDYTHSKRNITPEKAITILEKEGLKIGAEDVALMIDLLYFLALLFYKQHAAEL